ncbi:MAG: chemotaxis protein CheW [Baekduia sp.]
MSAGPTRQIVVFTAAGEEYAVPIGHVHEIIRFTPPRTVAATDEALRGVISLRGKIVPVLDLATRIGLDSAGDSDDQSIVIVEAGEQIAGLVVGQVEEVVTVDESQVDESPAVAGRAIDSIARIDDRLVLLLSPERLIGALDLSELDAETELRAA